eukprot:scaffold4242_cov175-Amphora_coffeaeformis.AAC.7
MMHWSKSLPLLCLLGHRATTTHAFTRSAQRATVCSWYSTTTTTTTTTTTALGASTQYLLTYDYIPDVLEKRGPFRAEHLQLAADAVQAGQCTYGGPKAPLEPEGAAPNGALFIFKDLQAAQEFVQKDPYVSGGIVTAHTIEAWTVAVSKDD